MEAQLGKPISDNSLEEKWSRMFILSLILHLVLFSTILFVPEPTASRKIRDVVYEVNLVEMPKGKRPSTGPSVASNQGNGLTAPVKATPAKRIGSTKIKEKPVVLAKRTVKVETKKVRPPEVSSAKLLDEALEKREKKAEELKKDSAAQPVSRVAPPAQETSGTGPVGRFAADGIIMDIYRAEIIDWVRSNWSYPVDLLEPNSIEDTYTVVVLKVEENGTILKTVIARSSGNPGYDQSVLKAIKRSDPLPPFPEGYRKTHEEIEINFNLSDLKNH